MIAKAAAWRPGKLARDTASITAWTAARAVVQALSLIALIRALGAEGYGILAGTLALFTTCGQFVGVGTGIALVRDAVRTPDTSNDRFEQTRTVYLASGAILFLITWPIGLLLFADSLSHLTIAMLAAAELIVAPSLLPLAHRLQADQRMGTFGLTTTIMPMVRLAASVALSLLSSMSIGMFAALYLALLTVTALSVNLLLAPWRPQRQQLRGLLRYMRSGFPYIVPSLMNTAGTELDKTMLLQHVGGTVTGQYTAAFRIMQAATLPVNGLMLAAVPRLFRSFDTTDSRGGTLVFFTMCYAVVAGAVVWALAPLTPRLFGEQFDSSVDLLRAFSLVLVVECLRQIITAVLTTADLQRARNVIEGTAAIGAVVGFAIAIPLFSVWGAIGVIATTNLLVVLAAGWLLRHRLLSAWR